jgi:multidrug efflux pump subunit AcrB
MNRKLIETIFLSLFFTACAISVAAQRSQEQRQERQSSRRERATRGAQTQTIFSEPLTDLEELDIKAGAVIVKNYTVVGAVSGFGGTATVMGYEFMDTQSGRKAYGVGVELEESERSERAALERLYVDYDELDALIKSLDYIIRIEKSTTMENFEAQYKTRSELTVTTFNRTTGTLRAAVSSGFIGRIRIGMTLGNLADFRKLLIDAKTALDKIK